MTKRTKLEETFDLPAIEVTEDDIDNLEVDVDSDIYDDTTMKNLIVKADKIDAALPQVSGIDSSDKDYDGYAAKAIDAFTDLIDLGKNVDDRHAAEIFNAASSMLSNALSATNNKAQKKLEMVKLQINKEKLEHDKDKLRYLKRRHLKSEDDDEIHETEGTLLTTRNDLIADILAEVNNIKTENNEEQ